MSRCPDPDCPHRRAHGRPAEYRDGPFVPAELLEAPVETERAFELMRDAHGPQ